MPIGSMSRHWQATRDIIDLLTRHRQLTWAMTKREFSDRYSGQVLGMYWGIGHPFVAMSVYLVVFSFIFKMKISRNDGLPYDYPVYLMCGIAPWLAFQEALAKACTAISSNASLVKQVVFPLEVLPVKSALTVMLTPMVAFVLLGVYCLVLFQTIPWTWVLLPVLLFFQILCMVGISFLLSSVGVFFRDIKDVVQLYNVVGMYVIPAVYVQDLIPQVFRPFVYANPFSYMVWCYQDVCYYGRFEHPWAWLVFPVFSLLSFSLGFRVFLKLKIMFGNVL